MNLGFKPYFVQPILDGIKKHTIREDAFNRWKAGMAIHFAIGIRTPNYKCFKRGICVSTQKIEFKWKQHNKGLVSESWGVEVFIDDKNVTNETEIIDALVSNDGFQDRKEFFEWEAWHKKNFVGKIIHFTNLRY